MGALELSDGISHDPALVSYLARPPLGLHESCSLGGHVLSQLKL